VLQLGAAHRCRPCLVVDADASARSRGHCSSDSCSLHAVSTAVAASAIVVIVIRLAVIAQEYHTGVTVSPRMEGD
jgi:hypothetical protein